MELSDEMQKTTDAEVRAAGIRIGEEVENFLWPLRTNDKV